MPYTKTGSLIPVFNTRDDERHKQLKNPIAPLYSLTNVVTFEPFVDQVLQVFFEQLDERYVRPRKAVDLGNWLQYFTFDVMGTMTFPHRYGFLEQGRDVGGMLEKIWKFFITAAPVSARLDLWRRLDRRHCYTLFNQTVDRSTRCCEMLMMST